MEKNHHHPNSCEPTLLDALYCEEEVEDESEEEYFPGNGREQSSSLLPLLLLEQDLLWEDEELLSLFSREEAQREEWSLGTEHSVSSGSAVRGEAVEWMLAVSARYGFSPLTAVLSTDYVDRFLSRFRVQSDKPWMIQLVAVACLSLAAKVEETYVPLLLDFQVGEAEYVFEAKAIQRMELLVLSTLRWKMHPVTPLSFVDHIIRRLGIKSEVHWEFFRRCEALLLSVVSDSRSIGYLPSVMATATMLHVIEELEPRSPTEYQEQLLRVLRMDKEKVDGCCQLILELPTAQVVSHSITSSHKRKLDQVQGSLSTGATQSSSMSASEYGTSRDCSWSNGSSFSRSLEVHGRPLAKRSRVQLPEKSDSCNGSGGSSISYLPSVGRVFIGAVTSPL